MLTRFHISILTNFSVSFYRKILGNQQMAILFYNFKNKLIKYFPIYDSVITLSEF